MIKRNRVPRFQEGGNFLGNNLGTAFELAGSLGNTFLNMDSASRQKTQQKPILTRYRPLSRRSILPRLTEQNEASYQTVIGNIAPNITAKNAAFSKLLGANNQAALADIEDENQFMARERSLATQTDLNNARTLNQIETMNIERENQRLADITNARNTGFQDLTNVLTNYKLGNQSLKELMLLAEIEGDTGTIERLAERLGYENVDSFLRDYSNPYKSFGNNKFGGRIQRRLR